MVSKTRHSTQEHWYVDAVFLPSTIWYFSEYILMDNNYQEFETAGSNIRSLKGCNLCWNVALLVCSYVSGLCSMHDRTEDPIQNCRGTCFNKETLECTTDVRHSRQSWKCTMTIKGIKVLEYSTQITLIITESFTVSQVSLIVFTIFI